MKCDQCAAAMIQGVFCHETGCPNSKKTWVPDRGWVLFVECFNCGDEIESGERCTCTDVPEDALEQPEDEDEEESAFCTDPRCGLPADHAGDCEEEKE